MKGPNRRAAIRADARAVEHFDRAMSVVDLDGPGALARIAEEVRKLLAADAALALVTQCEEVGSSLEGFAIDGMGAAQQHALRGGLDAWIRRSSGAWAFFDPRSPEPSQRNRALDVGTWREMAENRIPSLLARSQLSAAERDRRVDSVRSARSWFAQWGTTDAHQLRALVCEGPSLLAWVGVMHLEPLGPHARRRLQAVIPSLERRLSIEARLRLPSVLLASAILEELGSPAYVLDAKDRVVAINTAGRARRERQGRGHTAALADARRGNGDDRYLVSELASRGVPGHALMIEKGEARQIGSLSIVAERFGLTPREAEVASWLVRGATNRAIAVSLRCAERTVETHVSRILTKSECTSRSAFTAMCWTIGR